MYNLHVKWKKKDQVESQIKYEMESGGITSVQREGLGMTYVQL